MGRSARATKISLLALVAALAVAATAATASARVERPTATAPLIKVTLATVPTDTAAQGFYAQYQGFFRKQGLDVNVEIVGDPSQLAAAVLSGRAQFALTSLVGLSILHTRNAPIRLVASGALYSPKAPTTVLVANKDQRITKASDLVGKSIAIDARNSSPHISMMRWLKQNNVELSSVKFVEMPFVEMIGPLSRGTVDAAVMPEPFLTGALEQGAKRVASIFNVICPKDCLLTGWFSHKTWASQNPVTVAKFRNAIQAASVWANKPKSRKASAILLARYAKLDIEVINKTTRALYGTRLVPAMAQPWVDALFEYGVITRRFDTRDLVKP
jgi:ABC-type nitrate/sulfonate/bicarbonate transport system substrate-binding protein